MDPINAPPEHDAENALRDDLLTFLAQTSSMPSEESFFNKLARYLAQYLDMDFVCIDRLEGDGLTATTVAVWCDGHFEDNVSYALKDTPCGDVVGKTVCCFPGMVCQLFPNDQVLKDLRAESYVGATLWSHIGTPIGLIAVISRQPLANRPIAESIMQIVAVRAAGEIERLNVEKALLESEKKYRQMFQNQPSGFALHEIIRDPDGNPLDYRFLEINPAFERLTGLKATDLIGKTQLEVMPGSEPYWAQTYGKVSLTGEPISFENYSRELNRHYHVTAYSPEPGKFATVFNDITERKQIENELRDSTEDLKESQRIAHVGSWRLDVATNKVKWSEELYKMYGFDPKLPVPPYTEHQKLFKAESWEKLSVALQNTIDTGIPYSLELEFTRVDGTAGWMWSYGMPVRDEGGATVALRGMAQDITERKKAEEEKQVFEQQLQQTQKLESLGVLSGGIAHDFNNILAIIIGNCSLAKMDEENAGKYIPVIEKASERAAELCRQMLAYAGKAQFVQANVNMQALVDEMVSMLKKTIPQNVVIKLDSSADVPLIQGDISQLNQIVMNLIINASEAIGIGQGEVKVSLTETTIREDRPCHDHNGKAIEAGQYICLEVTDNGCGMDEETRWRIFEPFYTTKFTGRGLGMSAVLGIITSHKGALQLYSQLGQGSTFKVFLPVMKKLSTEVDDQKKSIPSASWQGSGTILLVEDEDQIRHIAKTLLEMIGFTVVEAVNGKEALDLYQQNASKITLVVTDMGMPVMDGYALFHSLKHLNPTLPIIISSGFGDADVTSRINHDDIAGLVSKPYTPDKLREVLKRALDSTLIV